MGTGRNIEGVSFLIAWARTVRDRARPEVRCRTHHARQVPAHTQLLAVDNGLCQYPDRTVVEHGDDRVKRQRVADALNVDVGEQVDGVPVGGIRRAEDHTDL